MKLNNKITQKKKFQMARICHSNPSLKLKLCRVWMCRDGPWANGVNQVMH